MVFETIVKDQGSQMVMAMNLELPQGHICHQRKFFSKK